MHIVGDRVGLIEGEDGEDVKLTGRVGDAVVEADGTRGRVGAADPKTTLNVGDEEGGIVGCKEIVLSEKTIPGGAASEPDVVAIATITPINRARKTSPAKALGGKQEEPPLGYAPDGGEFVIGAFKPPSTSISD